MRKYVSLLVFMGAKDDDNNTRYLSAGSIGGVVLNGKFIVIIGDRMNMLYHMLYILDDS